MPQFPYLHTGKIAPIICATSLGCFFVFYDFCPFKICSQKATPTYSDLLNSLSSELMDHLPSAFQPLPAPRRAPVCTGLTQHSPLGFVLLCSDSWGQTPLAPPGTEPPSTESTPWGQTQATLQ